jgi:hypothetical protein
MIFPALLAKFLSAGAVAQAATGAGVVVVAVAGAGTVGVLPGPAQDTFSDLVGTEEVVEAPGDDLADDTTAEDVDLVDEGEGADPAEIPAAPELEEDAELEEEAEEPTEQELWAENGPIEGQSFGSWVSEGARQGWADGRTVSEWAHKRNEERRGSREEEPSDEVVEAPDGDATEGEVTEGETTEGDATEGETEAANTGGADTADKKDRGNGRGNGRG